MNRVKRIFAKVFQKTNTGQLKRIRTFIKAKAFVSIFSYNLLDRILFISEQKCDQRIKATLTQMMDNEVHKTQVKNTGTISQAP